MWPPPDDPAIMARMRAAHATARTCMEARMLGDRRETWGWHGRTLSQPVITTTGPGWLRLSATLAGHASAIFWEGAVEAEQAMPATVPRPRLRHWHDWSEHAWQYRAELYDLAVAKNISASAVLTTQPRLSAEWWSAARDALRAITTVSTTRHTITRTYLRQAMPRLLGTPIDPEPPFPWTTAHGDFHFANITAPALQILDFEGWGLAPAGYDAATLHSHSLLVPATAARIQRELASLLSTPAGRHAELVAITELLDAVTRGDHTAIARPLHQRACMLLGRQIPAL